MDNLDLSAADRLLVVAPHPDDETLGAGGLLQRASTRGAAVRVCYATSGENNPWAQRGFEHRLVIGAPERARFGALRQAEARTALAALGLEPACATFLGLPDQGLRRLLLAPEPALPTSLRVQIDTFRPTTLAMPSPLELHPDHSALAVAVHLALADAATRPRLLAYIVHHPALRRTAVPRHVLALSDAERSRKLAAIAAHRSQLVWRGSWLAAFAAAEERFHDAHPAPGVPGHPIRAVRAGRGRLELDLVGRPRARAFGRRRLWLVGRRGDRQVRLTADLPALGRERPIVDLADGTAAGRCRLDGPPWRRHVVLEATGLDAVRPLWGHVERRIGFFDEAGWVLLAGPDR